MRERIALVEGGKCNETAFSARAVYVHELVKIVISRRVRVVKSCAKDK